MSFYTGLHALKCTELKSDSFFPSISLKPMVPLWCQLKLLGITVLQDLLITYKRNLINSSAISYTMKMKDSFLLNSALFSELGILKKRDYLFVIWILLRKRQGYIFNLRRLEHFFHTCICFLPNIFDIHLSNDDGHQRLGSALYPLLQLSLCTDFAPEETNVLASDWLKRV